MFFHGGWLAMFFGPIVLLVIFAGLIAAAMGWRPAQPGQSARSSPDPLAILKERFARGEIDKEEFEERRRLLRE